MQQLKQAIIVTVIAIAFTALVIVIGVAGAIHQIATRKGFGD